ncbi:MAG: DUF371 domain-containing protein [Nanoarchaeota archaeon]
MQYKFNAYGHPNILATHKTTLEFTKDKEVSLKGDCIVGINADFESSELKNFIKSIKNNNKRISITITSKSKNKKQKKIEEIIKAELNPNFNSNKEFVIRKTDFVSERTFAIRSNKTAFDFNRELVGFLKEKKSKISVIIENKIID